MYTWHYGLEKNYDNCETKTSELVKIAYLIISDSSMQYNLTYDVTILF